jgi:hypothetical protein
LPRTWIDDLVRLKRGRGAKHHAERKLMSVEVDMAVGLSVECRVDEERFRWQDGLYYGNPRGASDGWPMKHRDTPVYFEAKM